MKNEIETIILEALSLLLAPVPRSKKKEELMDKIEKELERRNAE